MGSSITSKPLADRKDFELLPKATKNPNIAKSLSKTCSKLILTFVNSFYVIRTMQLNVHKVYRPLAYLTLSLFFISIRHLLENKASLFFYKEILKFLDKDKALPEVIFDKFKLPQVQPCDLNIWLIPKCLKKIYKMVNHDMPTKTLQFTPIPFGCIKSISLYDSQWLYLQICYAYSATQTYC